jgi:UrcA family protein
MRRKHMKMIIIAATLAALTTPAMAASVQQSMSVKISDLNLASEAGQESLALRINRAAKALCESEALSQSPHMQRAERRCVATAKASALAAAKQRYGVQAASR